jgi:LPPG:FO 2-phospho-L-lactate transferase
MKVTALAGGIGAGKFLRGLRRVVPGADLTVIVNVADDLVVHGLHVSPDPDSVTYWLGDAFDRERGWGRRGETFRATEEVATFDPERAWFGLGDLDLGTHLFRTGLLAEGATPTEVMHRIGARFGVEARLLPVSDDRIETRIDGIDLETGAIVDLHFQEYWVKRHGADAVTGVRYVGAAEARPAPGVLEAIAEADAVVFCPSNPVVSIGPILAVPGVRDAVAARRDRAVGVSGIVGGAPVAGMADKLMPAVGIEVSAAGVANHYRDLLTGWLLDDVDAASIPAVEVLGLRCAAMDTLMVDDPRAEAVARGALELLG